MLFIRYNWTIVNEEILSTEAFKPIKISYFKYVFKSYQQATNPYDNPAITWGF